MLFMPVSMERLVLAKGSSSLPDLKTDNIMLPIVDQTMYEQFEEAEAAEPSTARNVDEDQTVYMSRAFPKPPASNYGLPILCDFGESRIGVSQSSGPHVQPHIYRAPEVIFEMPWGPSIDIWNLACLVRSHSPVSKFLGG